MAPPSKLTLRNREARRARRARKAAAAGRARDLRIKSAFASELETGSDNFDEVLDSIQKRMGDVPSVAKEEDELSDAKRIKRGCQESLKTMMEVYGGMRSLFNASKAMDLSLYHRYCSAQKYLMMHKDVTITKRDQVHVISKLKKQFDDWAVKIVISIEDHGDIGKVIEVAAAAGIDYESKN